MVPCARVRGRSVRADLVLMAALLASTLLCTPVAADLAPFPDLAPPTVQEGFFFHVQPVSADFCDQQTIWECSQIRQSTPDTGTLEFDLFVYSKRDDPQMSINGLSLPLEWTESWHLINWECCSGGQGQLDPQGQLVQLTIEWPERPALQGRLFLAARFIMDAPDGGWFGVSGMSDGPQLRFTCSKGDLEIWWVLPGWAEAGVECGQCYVPCDLLLPCRSELTPDRVDLRIMCGATATAQIRSRTGARCQPAFASTADWLTLEVSESVLGEEGLNHELTLRADAGNLAAGSYVAWIRSGDDCTTCARVVLTVIPQVPVEAHRSWGQVKEFYRP